MTISKKELEIGLFNLEAKKAAMEKAFGILFKAHHELVLKVEAGELPKEVKDISEKANQDALVELGAFYSF